MDDDDGVAGGEEEEEENEVVVVPAVTAPTEPHDHHTRLKGKKRKAAALDEKEVEKAPTTHVCVADGEVERLWVLDR